MYIYIARWEDSGFVTYVIWKLLVEVNERKLSLRFVQRVERAVQRNTTKLLPRPSLQFGIEVETIYQNDFLKKFKDDCAEDRDISNIGLSSPRSSVRRLLSRHAVVTGKLSTFRNILVPPSSGSSTRRRGLLYPEKEGISILLNDGESSAVGTA